MQFLREVGAVLGKEMRIELRTGELIVSTLLFSVLVTVACSFAFVTDPSASRPLGAGTLWLAVTFSAVLALGRSFAREREGGALRGVLLSGASPAAVYLGKALGIWLFLTAIEAVILPLVALFFHLDLWPLFGRTALVVVLGTGGIVAPGTLFATMTVRTRGRELMLSVVLFPLLAPALLAAVVATRDQFAGAPLGEIADWLRLLVVFNLVFWTGGLWFFGPLAEER